MNLRKRGQVSVEFLLVFLITILIISFFIDRIGELKKSAEKRFESLIGLKECYQKENSFYLCKTIGEYAICPIKKEDFWVSGKELLYRGCRIINEKVEKDERA